MCIDGKCWVLKSVIILLYRVNSRLKFQTRRNIFDHIFLYLAYRIDTFCRMLDVMVYWDQRTYWTDAGYVEETIRVYPDRHRNLRGHSRDTVNVHRLVV